MVTAFLKAVYHFFGFHFEYKNICISEQYVFRVVISLHFSSTQYYILKDLFTCVLVMVYVCMFMAV